MNKMAIGMALLVVATACPWASAESRAASGTASKAHPGVEERQFLLGAAAGDMAEIALGKLAEKHAVTPSVQAFGQRMIRDHSQNLNQVKKLAATFGLTLPKQPSSELNSLAEQVAKLKGKGFDRAYIDGMITDHTNDVEEFTKEIKEAKDPEVKRYARETLAVLQEHLELSRTTRSKL